MLNSIIELITQASSNFHLIFCFCNILIVILLIDRSNKDSKCSSTSSSEFLQIVITTGYENYGKVAEDDDSSEELSSEAAMPIQYDEEVDTEEDDDTEEDEDDYDYGYGYDYECDEELEYDSDELKKRIEEFINKTHREWRAERLRLSSEVLY
ncbi:Frequency clock protein [Bienertia sinuspersici]